ncbi:MAG: hypothetical protein JO199_01525 [Candidatus Eremiobacteraeota bacterium]|nr:hypothetical protein [Candidatus Eremiobacteraeota bacterium]
MRKATFVALLTAALAFGVAACSATHSPVLPNAVQAPAAAGVDHAALRGDATTRTRAVYAIAQSDVIETWSGPTAQPKAVRTHDDGAVDVTMLRSGTDFTMRTVTKMNSGSNEDFVMRGQFVASGRTSSEYFYNDGYQGFDASTRLGSSYSGKDRWPNGEVGVVFPLKGGSTWSSAAADNYSIDNIDYTGVKNGTKVGMQNTGEFAQQASGFYTGRDSWVNTSNGQQQFTERFDVASPTLLRYDLLLPGYSPEGWQFSQPQNQRIAVTVASTGKAAYPQGTKDVPDWYPGGRQLPANLLVDNLTVLKEQVTPPAGCKLSGTVQVVVENWHLLDPVAGSLSTGSNDYYGWDGAGTFPRCVVERTVHRLYANGLWYVDWLNGKPYYQETENLTEVMQPATGASPAMAGSPSIVPVAVRAQAIRSHLAAQALEWGFAPGQ